MAKFKIVTDAETAVEEIPKFGAIGSEKAARIMISVLSKGKRISKALEAKRKELNAPAQLLIKGNGAKFSIMGKLDEVMAPQREKLLDWFKAPGSDKDQKPLPEYDMALEGNDGGVAKLKTLWDFEILDAKAFLKANPEFIGIDESKLKAAIRRKDEPIRELKGARIFNSKTLEIT